MLDSLDTLLNSVLAHTVIMVPTHNMPKWTSEEVAYLRENHGRMTDHQMAQVLGRSPGAVKVFRTRKGLAAASQVKTDLVTTREAGRILNVEMHAVAGWVREGMLPSLPAGPNGHLTLINRRALTAWAVNPDNWPYFDWRGITDPHLRRLCELRAQRWGDEWWTTRQVADHLGVDPNDIVRHIVKMKTLPGWQPPHSIGGRHVNRRWVPWFVKRSDALNFKVRKAGDDMCQFTPRGDAWILRAKDQLGMTFRAIGRTMDRTDWTISKRYYWLKGGKNAGTS
jgi:hypothetical protein